MFKSLLIITLMITFGESQIDPVAYYKMEISVRNLVETLHLFIKKYPTVALYEMLSTTETLLNETWTYKYNNTHLGIEPRESA